jgi:hypothetical protein
LKLFFEIIQSGDLNKLVIKGKPTQVQVLEQAWEAIMAQYAKLDNNVSVSEILDLNAEAWRLTCEQAEVKAILLYLVGAYNEQYVERLVDLGYPIDMSSLKSKKKSLVHCDKRANHIKTKLLLLQKRIEEYSKTDNDKATSFDNTMGWLAINLNFEASNDITVSRYLSYKSQILARQRASQKRKEKPVLA